MSAGPIAQAREAWTPPIVSTTAKDRVCHTSEGNTAGRGYCGRSSAPLVTTWAEVTCTDCAAARRADLAAKGTIS